MTGAAVCDSPLGGAGRYRPLHGLLVPFHRPGEIGSRPCRALGGSPAAGHPYDAAT